MHRTDSGIYIRLVTSSPPHHRLTHPRCTATMFTGAVTGNLYEQSGVTPEAPAQPEITGPAISSFLELASDVSLPGHQAAVSVPLTAAPAKWYLEHYTEEKKRSSGQRERYRLKSSEAARTYAATWGVSKSGFEIIDPLVCTPFCCHNKNFLLERTRNQYCHSQGRAHGNAKHTWCCKQLLDSLLPRKRKNCIPCKERNAKKGEGSRGEAEVDEKTPARGRALEDTTPAIQVNTERLGYRVHPGLARGLTKPLGIMYEFALEVPWRLTCKRKDMNTAQYAINHYFDSSIHANFDTPWDSPAPAHRTASAKKMSASLRRNMKALKRGACLPQWVHPFRNSVPSQQRVILRATQQMMESLQRAEGDHDVPCDLSGVLPDTVSDALQTIISVTGVAMCNGHLPKYPCDVAELLGGHPHAVPQWVHTETVGYIRRMNGLLRVGPDGNGGYKSTFVYTHGSYRYGKGAVHDLRAAMDADWDTGPGRGADAVHRVDLGAWDVFELMSDMLHAGPGNPSRSWRFMLFLSWPTCGGESDPDAEIGTFAAWKKFFREHRVEGEDP